MIRIADLHFSYARQPVLRGIDLTVEQGEIISILGPNGCGKSTLLRLLRGVLVPSQGQVLWQGEDAFRLSRKTMAQLAAVVPQSTQTPFSYPVREMVAMGRFARQVGFFGQTAADRLAVEKALAVTDTIHLAERPGSDLSGGELQRVLLARALAQEAPVLLLDEATSHLDLDHRLEIGELLLRLNREQGTTVVQVSHDLDQAAEISDRILLLAANGRSAALGTPAEVYTPDNLKQVFRVEVKVENNPYTGAPRTYPVKRHNVLSQNLPRIHLLCGGGSGGELLRKLHLAGCEVSVGPVNRGDSDQILACALGLETVTEEPFCPISPTAMQAAMKLCRQAELLIVSPTVWGPGNLACLDLVKDSLSHRIPVVLTDPNAKRDFTSGKAWGIIQKLGEAGAQIAADAEAVLEILNDSARSKKHER